MSKFFEDVSDVLSYPVKAVYNFATGNPKGNSIGDIWNNTVGDGNPYQQLVSDLPGTQVIKSLTGGDLSAPFASPSWQELGKPMQAFSSTVDRGNKIFPTVFQPYAQPVEAMALSVFNPLAGAAYNTAYHAGQNQAQPGAFDWGALGKDALINFGTAGLQMGANNLIQGANAANTAKAASTNLSPGSLAHAYDPAIAGTTAGYTGTALAPNAISSATNFGSVGSTNALGSFVPSALNLSANGGGAVPSTSSTLPVTAASQAPAGQGLYKAGVQATNKLAANALTSSLTPSQAQPISGVMDNFGVAPNNNQTPQLQWGDLLNAFGGPEGSTPNANGARYNQQSVMDMTNRLAANNFLQQTQARDLSLPAGQRTAEENSPYGNQLTGIQKGTDQAFQDLMHEVDNANQYYGVLDSNPGLTADQLNTYLQNPDTGVLGNFTIPQDQAAIFKQIRPLGPLNTSLL